MAPPVVPASYGVVLRNYQQIFDTPISGIIPHSCEQFGASVHANSVAYDIIKLKRLATWMMFVRALQLHGGMLDAVS